MVIIQLPRTQGSLQQPVAEAELSASLTEQLGSEDIIEVRELSSGLFNSTYKVTTSVRQLILKVAPAHDAAVYFNERYLMQREQSLSSRLTSIGNLIPRYLSFFTISSLHAFLQEYVEGELWYEVQDNLTTTDNDRLWRQLGEFANTVHQAVGSEFGYPKPHLECPTWYEFIQANVSGMMDDCASYQIVFEEMREYQSLLPRYRSLLDSVTESRLCHGDLWPRNVIINNTTAGYEIKAVIDAERAFWGDPISDWVLLLYDVPESFWHGYGSNLLAATDPKRLAIYRGMYYILNILESTRFPESIDGYRRELRRTNEILSQ